MSKSSKKKSHELRKQKKRAERQVRQSQFAKWRADGMNTKSKRFTKRTKSEKIVADTKHETAFCGNIACPKCFPLMPQHRVKSYARPVQRTTMAQFKNQQRRMSARA